MNAAFSVPLDNGLGNVFLSYCMGIGPGIPEFNSPGLDPPPFQKVRHIKNSPFAFYRLSFISKVVFRISIFFLIFVQDL